MEYLRDFDMPYNNLASKGKNLVDISPIGNNPKNFHVIN